ncbi:glycosyltransferase family 2 protein, partial [Methylophaga sp. UBA5088]
MSDLVSVIMPARNAGAFIKQSIESILQQTYTNFELIIVDDQSTDDTRNIAEGVIDARVTVVYGKAEGIASAINIGLKHAKGKYFCRCDSDDLFPENRLKIQAE